MTSHDRTNTLHLALNKYRESASPFYDEAIEDVMARAAQRGHLGKADIGAIAAWKRRNTITRWMRDFMSTADSAVREATATARDSALSTDGDIQSAASKARSALSPIPGFRKGDALASAVIYSLAPHRMAVYDRRAQVGLRCIGLSLTPKPGRYGRYMALIEQVIAEAERDGKPLSARDVDLALFTLGGPADLPESFRRDCPQRGATD